MLMSSFKLLGTFYGMKIQLFDCLVTFAPLLRRFPYHFPTSVFTSSALSAHTSLTIRDTSCGLYSSFTSRKGVTQQFENTVYVLYSTRV